MKTVDQLRADKKAAEEEMAEAGRQLSQVQARCAEARNGLFQVVLSLQELGAAI